MPKMLLILLVFVSFSCKSDTFQLFDPTYFGEGFKGITFTNDDGEILKEDSLDWCSEKNYLIGNYSFGPAYPNPIIQGDSFNLRFAIPKETFVKIYIINSNYENIQTVINSRKLAGIYSVRINTQKLIPSIYRVVFISGLFSCSGDIWIKGN